jgi:surfeit locus 1 family protein
MTILKLYFSRRWWWTTVLMLFAVGVMIRLGFWQLDRMASQEAFNEHVRLMQSAEPLDLNRVADPAGLPGMEYRAAHASGRYDFGHQVALRNQYWGDPDGTAVFGYHLLTPLVLEDGRAVLVDRGWIPGEYAAPASWTRFDENPQAAVSGILRLPLLEGEMGGGVPDPTAVPSAGGLDIWNYIDPARLEQQMPYTLLPVYLQQAPAGDAEVLPYKALPVLDLSEGTHLGYALQWYFYACLVFFGYPVYLRRQTGAGNKGA